MPDRHYQRTGKKWFFRLLTVTCLLAGAAVLGYAGYSYTRDNSLGSIAGVQIGRPAGTPSQHGAVASPIGDRDYHLVIDKLGIDAPVGAYTMDQNGLPQVPYQANLVAWYDFSSEPGTGGNAVFAGHRTWNGSAVFRHLEDLSPGDPITIRHSDGSAFVYQVTDIELVDPSGDDGRRWMAQTAEDAITVITCGGDYRKTNDPIFGAEYSGRYVVRATLMQSLPA